jgi:hypothetical protein
MTTADLEGGLTAEESERRVRTDVRRKIGDFMLVDVGSLMMMF